METHIYVGHKLARKLAEMSVYMNWWFELEKQDDPSDSDHAYAIVQAYSGDDTKEDFRIELAADCSEEIKEMWEELQRLMRYYVHLITTNPNDHK